jgi:hypothetical protein
MNLTVRRGNPLREKFEFEHGTPVWAKVSVAAFRYGIGRTKLFELITAGKIKSRFLAAKGNERGIRLINLQSLEDYINSFPE